MPKDVTTGRIYTEVVGGVQYGITDPNDVGPIIGTTSTDVATLCTHANINADALFKPYEHAHPDNPNFATGGADGKYGWTIPTTQNDWKGVTFRNALWEFNPPQTWYNLKEFNKYNHQVRFTERPWGVTFRESQASIGCSIGWGNLTNYGDEFVCPKAMSLFQDCYLVVAIIEGQDNFLYAQCSQYKVSEAVGDYFEIAKSAISLPSGHGAVVAVPFLAPLTGTALTALQSGTNNQNYLGNNLVKYNINYESKQYVYLYGTAPTEGIVIQAISPTIYEGPSSFSLQVRVTNNYNTSKTGAFYPAYIGYKEVEAAGYIYRDVMTDEIIKDGQHDPADKTVNFSLAAGASQVYTITGLDLYKNQVSVLVRDCTLITVRFIVPSGHSADTNYQDVILAQS